MFIQVLVQRIYQMEGPLGDTVASIGAIVMNNAIMFLIYERIDVFDRVVNNGIVLDPYHIARPERLSGVTTTNRIFYLRNRLLTRANEDVVIECAVTVPNDGIIGVR